MWINLPPAPRFYVCRDRARTMRPLPVVGGIIVALLGAAWALQGAYVLPATFMRGPEWIAIGALVSIAGAVLAFFGLRPVATKPAREPE